MLIRLTVNQRVYEVEVPPGLSLLNVLRDDLDLTGTRYGCGHGVCGACVVIVDGVATPSCQLTVEAASGASILTIEGLSRNGTLHAVQRAFVDEDAMQCGYCTSGMIMSAVALLAETPHPGDDRIREALAPHLCRCGVYGRVLRAVNKAAQ
jgi:aerobic-type carbon monoxide dehydrogenase small subunit (CoxS/CutS family)